ncbi:MAG: ABC transporter permease [Parabacteroides sp.]|nr:ABC transporter permease [Parabacteroides sp.]
MTQLKTNIHCIRMVALREIHRLVAKPLYIFCMLIAPLFCMVFFVSLMKEGLPTNLPIAVVDLDNSSTTRSLIRQLNAFEQTEVAMQTMSFTEARQAMQRGEVYGIFYIPENFSAEASTGKQPKLSFYTNGSYLIAGSLLFKDMKTISVLAGGAVGLKTGTAKGLTESQIKGQLQPIVINTHSIGNPWLNYSVYLNNILIPGVLQLMIFLVTVFSIGSEIKFGTSPEWLKTGNNSLLVSLAGKLLPHTVLFSIVGFLSCSILYGFNAFPLQSGWMPMLTDMFLLVLASQAVGIFMIGVLPTLRLGLSFASLFGMITFSIVGLSFPVADMHPTLQALANLFPLRHYFLIYVDQALNGRDLIYCFGHYLALMAFLILPFLIGRNLKHALLYFRYIP